MNVVNLLCVDDSNVQLILYKRRLDNYNDGQNIYRCLTAAGAVEAQEQMEKSLPDIMLLDIDMPDTDGIQFLKMIKKKQNLRHIPVIMVSSLDEIEYKRAAFQAGASDYIRKPFDKEEFLMRIKVQCENMLLHKKFSREKKELKKDIYQKLDDLQDVKNATIFSLAKLAESRDPETGAHLERIREYTITLARSLSRRTQYRRLINEQFINDIYQMSALHDIGKVGVPDYILQKQGPLSKAEYIVMKNHTVIGAEALDKICKYNNNAAFLHMARDIALSHHEKWDGSGYPSGLKEQEIPLSARIVSLTDIYDALSMKRTYKEALPESEVEDIMAGEAESAFDPEVYAAFLEVKHLFVKIKQKY
ncbi:MAG TPA: HD domain-containing phosphohydrolase [Spirochaetota bacterium]|nr:HD domain-containing phosphohydrolase [Spirochaetota bacterium]